MKGPVIEIKGVKALCARTLSYRSLEKLLVLLCFAAFVSV